MFEQQVSRSSNLVKTRLKMLSSGWRKLFAMRRMYNIILRKLKSISANRNLQSVKGAPRLPLAAEEGTHRNPAHTKSFSVTTKSEIQPFRIYHATVVVDHFTFIVASILFVRAAFAFAVQLEVRKSFGIGSIGCCERCSWSACAMNDFPFRKWEEKKNEKSDETWRLHILPYNPFARRNNKEATPPSPSPGTCERKSRRALFLLLFHF